MELFVPRQSGKAAESPGHRRSGRPCGRDWPAAQAQVEGQAGQGAAASAGAGQTAAATCAEGEAARAAVAAIDWSEPRAMRFAEAMDDDFNTSVAVSVLFTAVGRQTSMPQSVAVPAMSTLG